VHKVSNASQVTVSVLYSY